MMDNEIKYRAEQAYDLLKRIISIPSCTFEEGQVADYLFEYLQQVSKTCGANREECSMFEVLRIGNNIVAIPKSYNPKLQTLMLNAHIDTVQPAQSYTNNPYEALEKDGAIYGLGSNDDGGSVVALTQTFLHFMEHRTYHLSPTDENLEQGVSGKAQGSIGLNLVLVLSAEEERSGANGVSKVLEELPQLKVQSTDNKHYSSSDIVVDEENEPDIKIDFAIIGEPTGMRAAIAERGLLVLDGTAEGVSGHAARNEGVNALYKAIEDINTLRNFKFTKHSPLMGDVKLSVTQINAGTVHNVIPDRCTFVVDIRPTEQYTNSEIMELLQKEVGSKLVARNLKNRSSATPQNHLLMKAVEACGIETFVSPTTSDWMRMYYHDTVDGLQKNIPAIKIGPGDSARSHKADEYILKEEIAAGIETYICLINSVSSKIRRFMD